MCKTIWLCIRLRASKAYMQGRHIWEDFIVLSIKNERHSVFSALLYLVLIECMIQSQLCDLGHMKRDEKYMFKLNKLLVFFAEISLRYILTQRRSSFLHRYP